MPARGADAKAQLGKTNAIGEQQQNQANQLENQLIPDYTSMLHEGYTPEEKAGITTAGMEAREAPFDTASQEATNRVARTRNDAGYGAEEDQLARDKGMAMGNEAAGLQEKFGDVRLANERYGLAGLSDLYGGNQKEAESMYGLGPATLEQANKPPWWAGLLQQGIGAAGTVAGAYAGK